MNVTVGRFGDKRDPRQTLLEALNEADELATVVIVKRYKDNTRQCSWSDADSMEVVGLLAAAQSDALKRGA